MAVRLRDGLRVEEIDGEAVVLDRDGATVHRFTGDAVEALRLLSSDVAPAEVPERLVPAVDKLVAAGVVANPSHWTRRKVLLAGGAAWGAATVASVALSLPAAAASSCVGGQVSTGAMSYTAPGTYTYNTGAAETTALVRAWGGGGGGGGGNLTGSGGGGGGGEYRYHNALPVAPCAMYTVTVGAGGASGPMGASATAGGASSFGTLLVANGGALGAYSMGAIAAGGTGGMGGVINFNGGAGGKDENGDGGGGGGGAGHAGAGGAGFTTNGSNNSYSGAGAGGPGTPGGGAGGDGVSGNALDTSTVDGKPGVAPGGGGGGAPQGLMSYGGQGSAGGAGARGEVRVGL